MGRLHEINNLNNQNLHSVYNEQGDLLIYTTNGKLASFVADRAVGISADFRLRIGGDPGTRAVDKQGHWIRITKK